MSDERRRDFQMLEARMNLLEGVLMQYLLRTLASESVVSLVEILGSSEGSLSEFDLPARQRLIQTIKTLEREHRKLDV